MKGSYAPIAAVPEPLACFRKLVCSSSLLANVRFRPVADIQMDAAELHRHAGPMKRQFLIGTAVAVALFLGWLCGRWLVLPPTRLLSPRLTWRVIRWPFIFHIDFPMWRAAVHVLLWVAAMAAIVAYVTDRHWASTGAWLTFAATLVIGIYDVVQYGTIGSPTSIWTVLLLFLFALFTRFGPLAPRAKA